MGSFLIPCLILLTISVACVELCHPKHKHHKHQHHHRHEPNKPVKVENEKIQEISPWGIPGFINIKPRKEVTYVGFKKPNENVFEIIMREEIEGEVILALLNYTGEHVPTLINPSISAKGENIVLGAEIRSGDVVDGRKWYLVIKNRQDFDSKHAKAFRFSVRTGQEFREILISISDIQDIPPTITGKTCQIPEFYVGVTNCTYTVTSDTLSLISMSFYVIARQGVENKLFGIKCDAAFHRPTPKWNPVMTREITLISLQRLEYDVNRLYIFPIMAKDSASNQGRVTAVVQVKKSRFS